MPLVSSWLLKSLAGSEPVSDARQGRDPSPIVLLGNGVISVGPAATVIHLPAVNTALNVSEAARLYRLLGRRRIIASYPAHEREARTKGIPSLGSGMIFPVLEEERQPVARMRLQELAEAHLGALVLLLQDICVGAVVIGAGIAAACGGDARGGGHIRGDRGPERVTPQRNVSTGALSGVSVAAAACSSCSAASVA